MSTRRSLTNTPDVVSIGLVWDSERPTFEHICDVFRMIDTVLHPADVSGLERRVFLGDRL